MEAALPYSIFCILPPPRESLHSFSHISIPQNVIYVKGGKRIICPLFFDFVDIIESVCYNNQDRTVKKVKINERNYG